MLATIALGAAQSPVGKSYLTAPPAIILSYALSTCVYISSMAVVTLIVGENSCICFRQSSQHCCSCHFLLNGKVEGN